MNWDWSAVVLGNVQTQILGIAISLRGHSHSCMCLLNVNFKFAKVKVGKDCYDDVI